MVTTTWVTYAIFLPALFWPNAVWNWCIPDQKQNEKNQNQNWDLRKILGLSKNFEFFEKNGNFRKILDYSKNFEIFEKFWDFLKIFVLIFRPLFLVSHPGYIISITLKKLGTKPNLLCFARIFFSVFLILPSDWLIVIFTFCNAIWLAGRYMFLLFRFAFAILNMMK